MKLSEIEIKKRTQSLSDFSENTNNFQFVEWMQKDNSEIVKYSFYETKIGRVLIANTSKGICFLGFSCGSDMDVIDDFRKRFPKQKTEEQSNHLQKQAAGYCNGIHNQIIPLHLKGTEFQLRIWKKLVRIPRGWLSTYSSILQDKKAARAVGTAVGANPVSYIIPCHRVVRQNGSFHGYHWGIELKKQLLINELYNE
jgi:O-6-methylguanine DNA methyltransferase